MDIAGKVVIVTGASSGIGLAAAKMLSGKRARLCVAARSKDKLDELAGELPDTLAVKVDMTNWDSVRSMVAETHRHFGRVDVLVNNAGRAYDAKVEDIDPDVFEDLYRLNVLGPVMAMKEVIPLMRAQGGGSIVNINSGTALMKVPSYGVYSSSKRALVGLSLTAREELIGDGILVSSVYPFITNTNFGVNKIVAKDDGTKRDYTGGDSPEFVSEMIVRAIEEGGAEYFAHERMRTMDNR